MELIKLVLSQQQDDANNTARMLSEALQAAQPPDPTAQMRDWMQGMVDAMKELAQRQSVPPPPAQNPIDIAATLAALQSPAAPVQPPIDIAGLMREMRNAIQSGQTPPAPPAGIDPGLLDLLKNAMQDMKDMQNALLNAEKKTDVAPVPPSSSSSTSSNSNSQANQGQSNSASSSSANPVLPPLPPPPGISSAAQQQALAAQLQAMMDKMNAAKPLPLPTSLFAADNEIADLKKLLAGQLLKGSQPIVLPPPIVPVQNQNSGHLSVPPPPPPMSGTSKQDILSLINSAMPKPQRIPAPPVINQSAPSPCCAAPLPSDNRPDDQRCAKVGGTPIPRCKRTPPSILAKCRRNTDCSTSIDSDGDVDVNALQNSGNSINFNPKILLSKLCPGGRCTTQPLVKPISSQSVSI